MKKKLSAPLLAVILLIAAALTGLLVPAIVVNLQDRATENTVQLLQTDAISLRYETNLTVLKKLELLQSGHADYTLELDQGVSMQKDEVHQLLQDFIDALSGGIFSFHDVLLQPYAVFYESGRSIVLWHLQAEIGEDGTLRAIVDDASGAILLFELNSFEAALLIPEVGVYDAVSMRLLLLGRFTSALKRNLGVTELRGFDENWLHMTDDVGAIYDAPLDFWYYLSSADPNISELDIRFNSW